MNLSNNKLPCKYQISIYARNIILVNQKVTDVLQRAQQKVLRLVYRDQNACKGMPLYYAVLTAYTMDYPVATADIYIIHNIITMLYHILPNVNIELYIFNVY